MKRNLKQKMNHKICKVNKIKFKTEL